MRIYMKTRRKYYGNQKDTVLHRLRSRKLQPHGQRIPRILPYDTDLNVVVGLCVGHDSLFYKYSEAMVTTAVTKDRVLGHNPAAALYTAESYYKKKLF